VRVAFCSAAKAEPLVTKMTSGARATNSAAYLRTKRLREALGNTLSDEFVDVIHGPSETDWRVIFPPRGAGSTLKQVGGEESTRVVSVAPAQIVERKRGAF
jgi:hypothetical protein